MSDSIPLFAKLVPGFEFMHSLVDGAGASLPSMGKWVAPTLNPDELNRRIEELRTVQFWLEQNARVLAATIQALEVQRMTLSTLNSMNVPLATLHEAVKVPEPAASEAATPPRRKTARKPSDKASPGSSGAGAGDDTGAPAVDPMQWWGALTKQFTQLATQAVNDAAKAGAMAMPASAPSTEAAPGGAATGKSTNGKTAGKRATGGKKSTPAREGSARAPR
jgi:hypothetical protein